tara:strand:+ start:216 stop:2006 length:1791 start_codon:yes stop_codon:yes gene_type:complete
MTKLSIKVFFILLPLAASILGFGYAYFEAKQKLTLDHIFRSSQLSALLGANEISHYIEGRFAEFDRLSSAISFCRDPSQSLTELSSNALSFTNGFSALVVTDLTGKVVNFHLSANKSNRYVLRQDLKNARVLPPSVISLLQSSYEEWRLNYPRNIALEKSIQEKLLNLQGHGEENSQASRDLSSQLNKLRGKQNLPKQVVNLSTTDVITRLGLIFDNETYFYSRPLINCEKELVGYYTAVLDRTLIENQLFDIKRSLTDSGLEYVDVFVVRNDGLTSLSSSNYMRLDKLQRNGLNSTISPAIRNDLGGVMINQPIGINVEQHLVFDDNINMRTDSQGVTLVVFVSEKEIEKQNKTLVREVSLYLALAAILFIGLSFYLSHYIASPISDLRRRISKLSRIGQADTDYKVRDDEIGDLFDAFSDMATKIKQKESQLTRLAREDPLTGVLNRRAFVDSAAELRRLNASCCICMMDLDHFKQVNDTCGHAVGDDVLIAFCHAVSKETREADVFGRLGGEEFALLLPETALSDASHIAERIRIRVEDELAEKLCSSHSQSVTVSIGIVDWPKELEFNQALAHADRFLYQAKANGRNQIVVE